MINKRVRAASRSYPTREIELSANAWHPELGEVDVLVLVSVTIDGEGGEVEYPELVTVDDLYENIQISMNCVTGIDDLRDDAIIAALEGESDDYEVAMDAKYDQMKDNGLL